MGEGGLVARREYTAVFKDVAKLLETARTGAARSVNAIMTTTYWLVGRRIVDGEQRGSGRAKYGEQLLAQLSVDLTRRFGRGFGPRNLALMRAFFLDHREILQALPAKSSGAERAEAIARAFPLPWTHYVRLLAVRNENARRFYEQEALRGGWSSRQLDRQIQSQFFERRALSRRSRGSRSAAPREPLRPEDTFRSPFVLEFLDLKDEYSESEFEARLISKLEAFLIELGGAFTFVGRQRRLRIGDEWYRVDLLFFHRELKCLVVIDLKLGKFTHADAGQMHMYLNYARAHWTLPHENPPVGLILCAEKDQAVAKYALDGLPNKVLAAEYRTLLPRESELEAALRASSGTRRRLSPGSSSA